MRVFKKYIKEILLCLAWLIGWGLTTLAFVDLYGFWIWKLSCGLLLLGVVGYRFIFKIMVDRLYMLSLEEKED
ncbi:hypothetical protein U472_09435 [Orenia metallireducens]|uniref:Uncharacterized protein n=1 Tax=Orenia metallireducens TaxID=1413210 RepID=A0A1C0A7N5_9FIRM|nr:hypothetical protein [Orenia metallireducens]OCL26224.1 hypothetical protein U472_09435 [Orenia metallireducens]